MCRISPRWARVIALTLAGVAWLSTPTHAIYSPNSQLRESLESDRNRLLPKSDWIAWALDLELFKPVFLGATNPDLVHYGVTPYHGNGFWLDTRAEFRPVRQLTLNLKTTVLSGTTSSGFRQGLRILPSVGLTGRFAGGDFRAHDLGRLTYGNGLLIQEKETEGVWFRFYPWSLIITLYVDGTAGHNLYGDLMVLDVTTEHRDWGAYAFYPDDDNQGIPALPLTLSLYGMPRVAPSLTLRAEAAINSDGFAALAGLNFEPESNLVRFRLAPEIRYTSDQFSRNLNYLTQHVYTAYDQQDQDFVEPIYLLGKFGEVWVPSLKFQLARRMSPAYELFTRHELGRIQMRITPSETFWFFDAGFRLYPVPDRDDFVSISVGNKELSAVNIYYDSLDQPHADPVYPNESDYASNKPRFFRQLSARVIFRTSF